MKYCSSRNVVTLDQILASSNCVHLTDCILQDKVSSGSSSVTSTVGGQLGPGGHRPVNDEHGHGPHGHPHGHTRGEGLTFNVNTYFKVTPFKYKIQFIKLIAFSS